MTSELDEFARSVRSLTADVATTDNWRPGSHCDDRSEGLTAGLDRLGWNDLVAGDEESLPFLAVAALELGRAATTPYDVVQILGGSPLVQRLAMYGQQGRPVAIATPEGSSYQLATIRESTEVAFADSLGVHSVSALDESMTVEEPGKRLTAWETATVGYFAGLASFVVDSATQHALEREIFGRTLAHLETVQQRLGDAAATVDALVLSAQAGAHGLPALAHAAASTWSVMVHGHMVFGAIGFTLEFPLQRYSRRAKALGSFVDGWIDQRIGQAV
jgi:hypothetical protein